jgi:CheY-like chemotaxis protein
LQLLGGHGVSLLLTDIRLPGEVNGIALARRVKRSQPEVKILLAGVDVDQFSSQDLDGIADGILRKPFRIPELQERVANLIGDLGR